MAGQNPFNEIGQLIERYFGCQVWKPIDAPRAGELRVLGRSPLEARPRVGYAPPIEGADWRFPISVGDVALLGRFPRLGPLRRPEAEDRLAVERGELEGYCGWSVGSIVNRASGWLHDGTLTLLAQFTRDLPNVPVARDLMPTESGKRVIDFLAADVVLAWPLIAPPDLPTERVQELRAAFLAMIKDPELRADADKLKLEIAPVSGQEMQGLVEQLYASPPDVIELIKKINSAQ